MSPSLRVSGLAALLTAALATSAFADPKPQIEATGVVETAPGDAHQPELSKVRLRTPDGTLYTIGAGTKEEPGFYANFVGRTITVRGRLHPAPQAAWSDGVDWIRTGIREGDDPQDAYAPYLERAPMVSPALAVFEGVVDGATLRTPAGPLELVGPVAGLVLAADGRSVSVQGYAFPADAPTELFVVAVQGKVRSAARYRDVAGKKKRKLASRGRRVWVQGTAASGAPSDPIKNITVRASKLPEQADALLLVDKELLTEWDGPGLASACVIPIVKLWWSKTTFLVYVGKYLPSSAIEIGEEAGEATPAGKGLSSLGQ